jgi:hypothetical protein
LHEGHTGRFLAETKIRHSGRDGARTHDEVFVPRQVQLVDERAHAQGIDAAARRNYTGSDFDDQAHNASNLTVLARIGQVLTLANRLWWERS